MKSIEEYKKRLQIVVIAGGLGTRLRHRTGDGLPKPLLKVGNTTLLDFCINLYKRNGFKEFIFLLGYHADKIIEHVKKNYKDIDARFSVEPKLLGKGGALKFALANNKIDKQRPCIICYPDDLVLIEDFPDQLIRRHLIGRERGCVATVVRVNKTQFRYGTLSTDDEGIVVDFQEKPFIPYPANVAIYLLEPEVYDLIEEMVDLEKGPVDFEGTVVPQLVTKRKLFSFTIPLESWIPVNEEKEFRMAEKHLSAYPFI